MIENSYSNILSFRLTWQLSIPLLCLLFLSLEALVLYDYFHTKLTSSKSKESTKQKEFDELCKVLLRTKKYMHDTMTCYSLVKQENPFWVSIHRIGVSVRMKIPSFESYFYILHIFKICPNWEKQTYLFRPEFKLSRCYIGKNNNSLLWVMTDYKKLKLIPLL